VAPGKAEHAIFARRKKERAKKNGKFAGACRLALLGKSEGKG
jgi:hypothetical protein